MNPAQIRLASWLSDGLTDEYAATRTHGRGSAVAAVVVGWTVARTAGTDGKTKAWQR
jgi:hypothetical protein